MGLLLEGFKNTAYSMSGSILGPPFIQFTMRTLGATRVVQTVTIMLLARTVRPVIMPTMGCTECRRLVHTCCGLEMAQI